MFDLAGNGINLTPVSTAAPMLDMQGNGFAVHSGWVEPGEGVLVLRYHRHDQEYKFPFNLHVAGRELPVGLFLTTLVLGLVAMANLFSKQIATKYGVAFTIIFFVVFTISEQVNRRTKHEQKGLEQFNLDHQADIDGSALHARPGCVVVAIRDFHRMEHLKRVLEKTNLRKHDIVVMTVRPISAGAGEYDLSQDQLFSDYERELFSHVVEVAEKEGKPVELLVVPARRAVLHVRAARGLRQLADAGAAAGLVGRVGGADAPASRVDALPRAGRGARRGRRADRADGGDTRARRGHARRRDGGRSRLWAAWHLSCAEGRPPRGRAAGRPAGPRN